MTDSLGEKLAALKWPRPHGDHPDVAAGQLWRATWQDTVCLVVIVAPPTGRHVNAVAASADTEGDEMSVPLETDVGMAGVVWPSLSRTIPTFVLDRRMGELGADCLRRVLDAAGGTPADFFTAIRSALDDRSVRRAELLDRLETLSEAEWTPDEVESSAPTLREAAEQAGVSASDVAARLDVSPGSARRLLRGEREVEPQEALLLEDLIGPDYQVAVRFEPGLVEAMDLPIFRPEFERLAETHHGGDEVQARRIFASSAFAMAARHREKVETNWRDLVRERLDESQSS